MVSWTSTGDTTLLSALRHLSEGGKVMIRVRVTRVRIRGGPVAVLAPCWTEATAYAVTYRAERAGGCLMHIQLMCGQTWRFSVLAFATDCRN
jgi:hypothetical protein